MMRTGLSNGNRILHPIRHFGINGGSLFVAKVPVTNSSIAVASSFSSACERRAAATNAP